MAFLKKHWLVYLIIVIVAVAGGYFIFGRKKAKMTDFTAVKRSRWIFFGYQIVVALK